MASGGLFGHLADMLLLPRNLIGISLTHHQYYCPRATANAQLGAGELKPSTYIRNQVLDAQFPFNKLRLNGRLSVHYLSPESGRRCRRNGCEPEGVPSAQRASVSTVVVVTLMLALQYIPVIIVTRLRRLAPLISC